MITAREAKKQSLFNSTLKEEINGIGIAIAAAIKEGKFECTYSKYGQYTKQEETMILEELRSCGFKVEYDRNEMPAGCRSDQWGPYSYLKISWEEA